MVHWKDFYKKFIGNPSAYAIQKQGTYVAKKEKVTKEVIEKHLRKEITIGSYPIYRKNSDDLYCRWFCADIDLHALELEGNIIIDNSSKIKNIKFPIREVDDNKKPKKTEIKNATELEKLYWDKSGITIYEYNEEQNPSQKERKKLKEIVIDNTIFYYKKKYQIEANEYDKLETLTFEIEKFLSGFYSIPEDQICVEHSGRGYHIWIFLKNPTTLSRAWDLREDIKKRILEKFGLLLEEIYPRQNVETLVKLGNLVKLPFSINRKNNKPCKILDSHDLTKEGYEITNIVKHIRENNRNLKKNIVKKKNSEIDLSKWNPKTNKNALYFYNQLRPCMKIIVKGKQAVGAYGHAIRRCLTNELFSLKTPRDFRIKAFESQFDFDYNKTKYQVEDLERRNYKTNNFFISQCETIRKWGFCLIDCPYRNKTKEIIVKKKLKGIKGGHNNLNSIMSKDIQENVKNKRYVVKTTRSGATTSIILSAIENNKKIVVVGPTIRICEKTVDNVLNLTKKNVRRFRLGSNKDLCPKLYLEIKKYPVLRNYPFLYKPSCKDCNHTSSTCQWLEAKENIQNYDIIYITIAKMYALTQSEDEILRKVFEKIMNSVDIIFLDEVSHILNVADKTIEFIGEPNPVFKQEVKKKNFPEKFKQQFNEVQNFIMKKLTLSGKKIWNSLLNFLNEIEEYHHNWNILREDDICYRMNSTFYKEIDKWNKNESQNIIGTKAFIKIYKRLIQLSKTKDYYPDTIIDFMLLTNSKQIYLQYTTPNFYDFKLDLMPAKPIQEFIEFLNNLCKDKKFYCTDATEPPIPITSIFPNITNLIIDDPNDTAKFQIVYHDSKNICLNNLKFLFFRIEEIIKFVKNYGNINTLIICQNINISQLIRQELKKQDLKDKYYEITYFRSDLTIGTPSPCRTIITIGSPYPPKNSHRWLADLFIKSGFVEDMDIEELTKRLEYYNAKSTFFQSISRGKDPQAIEQSKVFCYGLRRQDCQHLLNFDVATPKIVSIEKYNKKYRIKGIEDKDFNDFSKKWNKKEVKKEISFKKQLEKLFIENYNRR